MLNISNINGNSQIKGTILVLDKRYTADKIRFTFVAKATEVTKNSTTLTWDEPASAVGVVEYII